MSLYALPLRRGCIATLGRFFSRDPREAEYAWQSTYAYYRNCPTAVVDYLGMGGDDPDPEKASGTDDETSCLAGELDAESSDLGNETNTMHPNRRDFQSSALDEASSGGESGVSDNYVIKDVFEYAVQVRTAEWYQQDYKIDSDFRFKIITPQTSGKGGYIRGGPAGFPANDYCVHTSVIEASGQYATAIKISPVGMDASKPKDGARTYSLEINVLTQNMEVVQKGWNVGAEAGPDKAKVSGGYSYLSQIPGGSYSMDYLVSVTETYSNGKLVNIKLSNMARISEVHKWGYFGDWRTVSKVTQQPSNVDKL